MGKVSEGRVEGELAGVVGAEAEDAAESEFGLEVEALKAPAEWQRPVRNQLRRRGLWWVSMRANSARGWTVVRQARRRQRVMNRLA